MKPKLIDYPLFHNPVEITNALVTVASQENCDGPEYDLMMNAADYIRLLESLLDIYVQFAGDREYGHEWMEAWKEWAENQKELSPEFVKIVEENFWELLE